MDVAGVRVICSFEEDVFFLAKCLKDQSDIEMCIRDRVCFALCEGDEVETVYAYCNLHSLWKA